MSVTTLTKLEIAHFRSCGFVTVPQLSNPLELERLRAVFARLFAQQAGRREGAHYDLVGPDEDGIGAVLPTIINPVNYAPELRALQYRRNAVAMARQLLGPSVTPAFEHAILKPPRRGAATPWHQDEAYRVDPNFAYRQISFWMPLDEATLENGCMHYIPGSHLGPVLSHRSFLDDPRIHAIECIGPFDAAAAQHCPLPPGGAVLHDGRTLHYAGPNRTDQARCAYILAFEVPPKPLVEARDFHWNRVKRTPNQMRRSRWRRRGGILIEALRKYRLGMLGSRARIAFELRRGLRALALLLKA
jgi:hypothetical protein